MKTIMILGAGTYQVPLIQKAKELGLYTVVVSYPGNYPGFSYADKTVFLDTRDREGILRAAEELKIDGIATTGTDVAIPALAAVCDRLGLPGLSSSAAARITEKAAMKQAFSGLVSTAPFQVVRSAEEAAEAASEIGFPVMVKACDVSGSRGITKVDGTDGIPQAFSDALAVSREDHVIVEKWVSGTEIGVDGFVLHGKLALCLPHEKAVARSGGVTVPAGHVFPFRGDAALCDRIRHEMEQVVLAAGLDNCALNADVMIGENGSVSVLEAGGRCGATGIPELITMHTGIDYYAQILKCALGEPTDFTVRTSLPCRSALLFSSREGRVQSIDREKLQALQEDPALSIRGIVLDVAEGDTISAMKNGTDRFGMLLLETDSKKTADEALKRVTDCIVY